MQHDGSMEDGIKKTGYFRAEMTDGKWWIVDPEGKPFFSKGMNNMLWRGDFAPKLGTWPYYEVVKKKYGTEEKWAEASVDRIRDWGFNTVGAWSDRSTYEHKMPFTVILDIYNRAAASLRTYKIDMFSDAFHEAAAQIVSDKCNEYKENRMLLGYFTDNELDWPPAWGNGETQIEKYWFFSAQSKGKQKLLEVIKGFYSDIEAFNRTWGTQLGDFKEIFRYQAPCDISEKLRDALYEVTIQGLKDHFIPEHQMLCMGLWFKDISCHNHKWNKQRRSFEEVLEKHGMTPLGREWKKIEDRFAREVSHQYFKVCKEAIYRYDSNHMILGCRFFGIAPQAVVEGMREQVDIISYNRYDFKVPFEQLRRLFRQSNLPVMLTEFSFKAMDSGLGNHVGGGKALKTQLERADYFEEYVKGLAEEPYVVGYHWFEYIDQPAEGRFDGEDSNYGVVNICDEPYDTLVERMKAVNGAVEQIHMKTAHTVLSEYMSE